MKLLTRAWVLKAEADLDTAGRELEASERPNYDAVCFHAHQCAERYLKARLQQDEVPFPETNHLVVLLHLCLDLEPAWIDCIDHLRFLTSALMHVQEAESVADLGMAQRSLELCRQFRAKAQESLDALPEGGETFEAMPEG